MGKPILFDTISRAKFDKLSDDIKAKKNYQIKEADGQVSKHIAGLEGGTGGGIPFLETTTVGNYIVTINTKDEIDAAWENGTFGIQTIDISSDRTAYFKSIVAYRVEYTEQFGDAPDTYEVELVEYVAPTGVSDYITSIMRPVNDDWEFFIDSTEPEIEFLKGHYVVN